MKRTWVIFASIIFVGALTFSILLSVHGQTPTMQHMNHEHETAAKEAAGNQVVIDNFSFTPATLTVAAGTQVTWTNRDDIPHTVVSTDKDKKIKSKALDTNDTFSFTFTDPGTYDYFCSLHPKMTAKIIVEKK